MSEPRGELRLTQEATPKPLVMRKLRREELQRSTAFRVLVLGEVHRAHGAFSEERQDAEPAYLRADADLDAH
jgi:hypothetical protein